MMKPEVRQALTQMLNEDGWVRSEAQKRDATTRFSRPNSNPGLFAKVQWGANCLVLGQNWASDDDFGTARVTRIDDPGNHRPGDLRTILSMYRN